MLTFVSIIIGYLIGSVNPSYLIAKCKGFDIRKSGSGNAGASNAVITMGAGVGAFSAIFDIMKAYGVYILATFLSDIPYAGLLAGTACILGHIFPFYMHFRGGKGLACLGGVILAFDWRVFLLLLGFELIVLWITNYLCLVPLSAAVIFPIIYGIMTNAWLGSLFFGIATLAIFYRHFENLKRIRLGTELRFSYLWHKEEELQKIQAKSQNN